MIALYKQKSHPVSVILTLAVITFIFSPRVGGEDNIYAQMSNQPSAKSALHSKSLSTTQTPTEQPIIFVHGISQDARLMGIPQQDTSKNAFVPLYRELTNQGGTVQTFWYLDDKGYADGIVKTAHCPQQYVPCRSQSSVGANAVKLDQMIADLYNHSNQQKVALIGYSMGAAIIRTALAGCPPNVTCQENYIQNIATMVNAVFFIAGVQQGSWIANEINPSEKGIAEAVTDLLSFQLPLRTKWGLGGQAALDLTPQSGNILVHNTELPPAHIRYFNFYGDVQFSLETCVLAVFCTQGKSVSIGDGIILPGTDNPQDTPAWGGARFCLQCNGSNFSQIDADTSYTQWPLPGTVSVNSQDLLNCQSDLTCTVGNLSDLLSAPQMHWNLPSDASLDGTAIQVQDTTGLSGTKTTSIAHEIALQLKVVSSSPELAYIGSDGNVWDMTLPQGTPRQLTSDAQPDSNIYYYGPTWSPDGKRLAVARSSGSFSALKLEMHILSPDGTVLLRVPLPDRSDGKPFAWSPDSTLIAYRVYAQDLGSQPHEFWDRLYLFDSQTGATKKIFPYQESIDIACNGGPYPLYFTIGFLHDSTWGIDTFTWSPDQQAVLVAHLCDDYESAQIEVTSGNPTPGYPKGATYQPGGTLLLGDWLDASQTTLFLGLTDATNQHVRVLASVPYQYPATAQAGMYEIPLGQAAWNSDGKSIYYEYNDGIWLIGADGSNAHLVVAGTPIDSQGQATVAVAPQPSPDGRFLLFAQVQGGDGFNDQATWHWYVANPDGTHPLLLSQATPPLDNPGGGLIAWRPGT